MHKYFAMAFVVICAGVLCSQPAWREQVGQQADGSFLLSNGWKLKPVGAQVPLDTLPMASVLSKDGKYLLVQNGGFLPPSIIVISTADWKEVSRVPVADAWLGLAMSPDGTRVYSSGAAHASVFEFSFSSGTLTPVREIAIVAADKRRPEDFIGDVAVSPDGNRIFAAEMYHDSIAVIDAKTGLVSNHFKTGRRPYRILFFPDGKAFFVSSWADASVFIHDSKTGGEMGRVRVGPHATDMVLSERKQEDADKEQRYRLFVAAANTNSVFVVSVDDTKQMKLVETINIAMTPRHPLGMTPSAVGLSPDQTKLYVACSDANTVAVADISQDRSRVTGFIPVGWYPTAVRTASDGRILVLNGRGLQSYPNPKYDGPTRPAVPYAGDHRGPFYVAAMQKGSLSVVDPPSDETLDEYSKTAQNLSPYRDDDLDVRNLPDDSVIVSKPGKPSPIEHVIYIVKENRTYDQVFGAIGKGNSDPSLCLFNEQVAPNHYKLARQFILFDNFYVNSDVSADGHNWAMASIAPDYVQKMWPNQYANRGKAYDFEGEEPANSPPAGYIWDNAVEAGITVRNYGYWSTNKKQVGADGAQVEALRDPVLKSITNMKYRGFDLDYPDVDRAKTFLEDVKQFESSGKMPQMMILRLGNDHTNGTTAGKLTPQALFADNDYALGMIVDGVSHSKFWPHTAIFIIEDDAQNGPDHVDSHRSPMLAISPYTERGIIDSSFYNQSSILRTMELILGMRPLTHFDAGAHPLYSAFAKTPNNAPYQVENPRISLTDRNPAGSATAARSQKMDFDEADDIDDDELNDILWIAIKGTEPPVPVRSYFSARK
jgi:YVTN family beta-propeller protein